MGMWSLIQGVESEVAKGRKDMSGMRVMTYYEPGFYGAAICDLSHDHGCLIAGYQ